MRSLLELVAPIVCLGCGTSCDGELCAACATGVLVLAPPCCDRCGIPTAVPVHRCAGCRHLGGFGRVRSLVAYAEPARAMTLALKRRGRRPLARAIGKLLGDLAVATGLYTGAEVVAFVPSGRRARERGFDHAELIAAATARALRAPARRLVVRTRYGPRQADVPYADRRDNVRGRFAARPVDARVLLVDDVFTTGATAEACSTALLAAGAPNVDVLSWARTLRRVAATS